MSRGQPGTANLERFDTRGSMWMGGRVDFGASALLLVIRENERSLFDQSVIRDGGFGATCSNGWRRSREARG